MQFRNAALILLVGALAVPAAAATVRKGSVIAVVLNTPVSSKTNQPGDKVELQIASAQAGFPEGTVFVGELTNVVQKTDTLPGAIEGKITTAILPDKTEVHIKAVPCYEKGEVRTVIKGKAPSDKKKTMAAKLGAIAAILVSANPEDANIKAGVDAGLARAGKPRDVEAQPGKKGFILIQEDVTLK